MKKTCCYLTNIQKTYNHWYGEDFCWDGYQYREGVSGVTALYVFSHVFLSYGLQEREKKAGEEVTAIS